MIIRRPVEADRSAWGRLYAGYAEFYKVTQTEQMRDSVWGWIHDTGHATEAFVAEQRGGLVGLAHFRPFARPLAASTGCYLDDLFVDPATRGSGAAEALIDTLAEEAHKRSWTVIRWITAENNFRARGLYERVADRTGWVTYDIKLS